MEKLLAVKCGKLVDGTGGDPLLDAVILIKDSEVIEVGEKLTIPQDAEVVDGSNRTVMPGLIDGHVHLNADPLIDPLQKLMAPDSLLNLRAAKNARTTLEAGFTSILGNCGYGHYADLFLKDAIDHGWVPGPRLFTSGPQVTSTLRLGALIKYDLPLRQHRGMADGVEELRKLVRRNIVSGADWIKVLATYYVGFPTAEPTMMNLNADELRVITDEAHAQRRKVKAHLEGEQTTKDALNADVDIVLHGFFLDDDDVELMTKKKISLIPTLAFPGEVLRTGAPGMPEWYPKKLKAYNQVHLKSLSRAKDAGVSIAAGSDCSGGGMGGDLLRHGENAKELQYLVMNGLTPMEALVAGTRNVAEAFGVSHLTGTIEAGKLADILVVNGDPLKDVVVLQEKMRIETVIKNGDVVVRDGNSRACACPPLK